MKKLIYDKKELLKALKTILKEYENKEHTLDKTKCSLCNIYLRGADQCDCDLCPMHVFPRDRKIFYPCTNRKCTPINSGTLGVLIHLTEIDTKRFEIKLQRVIAFYKAIIKKVSKITEKELNADGAFAFLVDIDNNVSKKYPLE